jgi:hypothetical protein
MPNIIQALEAIDTSKLTAHLQVANQGVSASGSAPLAQLDPRDLLGDLGAILKSPTPLGVSPGDLTGSLGGVMKQLESVLHIPAAETVADVVASFEALVNLLQHVGDQIGSDPEALVDRLFGDLGGLEKVLTDICSRALEGLPLQIPGELRVTLETFRSILGAEPEDPEHLASVLSQLLIGVDLNALRAPGAHYTQLLNSVQRAGGDLTGVHTEVETLSAKIRVASTSMTAPDLDLDGLEVQLRTIDGGLDVLFNSTLPGAIAQLTTDLRVVQPELFVAHLRELLDPLEAHLPGVPFDVEQDLVKPLKQIVQRVDAFTPATLTAMFDSVVQRIEANLSSAGLDQTLIPIDDLFDVIVAEMQRVPLRELRNELLTLLAGVEGELRQLPGLSLPDVLATQINNIQKAIDGFDPAAIQARVGEFANKISSAVSQFPIQDIKNEIESLIGAVRNALDEFKPLLETLKTELDSVVGQLQAIDFSQAGQASLDLVKGIRENVQQAVGSGDLPQPLQIAIGAAATALKGIDVKTQVSASFDAQLAKIDPKLALAPLDPILARIRELLEKVTPSAIIDQLDKPFAALLQSLERLKPAALLAGLAADFDGFVDLVGKLDPRTLVAPLNAEFQKLVKTFQDALDPAPLFAPLRAGYAKLQQLVDFIDLEKLLSSLLGKLMGLPNLLQSSMKSSIAHATSTADDLSTAAAREFRFGDIIRPLVAIIHRLKRFVTSLAEQLVGGALKLLDEPLVVLRNLAQGAATLVQDVAAALEARRGEINVLGVGDRAVELRAALEELSLIAETLPLEAKARLGPLVVSVQLDARMPALAGPTSGLDAVHADLVRGLTPPDLVGALNRFGDVLSRLVPAPLLATDASATVADRLAALFAAIDLEPLADEMDQAGAAIQAKMTSMIDAVAKGVLRTITSVMNFLEQLMPVGLLQRLHDGMQRIRAEVAVLDPAPIEAQVRELVDAAVAVLNRFSPDAIAGEFSGIVDGLKVRLQSVNPATLLGSLDPVANVITEMQGLRPSVVLQPLVETTADLTQALEHLIPKDLTAGLVSAVEKLKAELELVIQGIEAELESLLNYLEGLSAGGAAGGGLNVSASVGIG